MSHCCGTNCFSHVGVPDEVIKRAAHVLDAIRNNKRVARLNNQNISAHDQQYQVLCLESRPLKKTYHSITHLFILYRHESLYLS